ncbi:MAG: hypothetical protein AB7I29_13630 [Geobacter sp.]
MAKVSISQAARLAGITRQYFYKKYINTGVISVNREKEDAPTIDTAELFRVFGELQVDSAKAPKILQVADHEKDSKIIALEAEVRLKDELLKAKENHIADLQQSLRLLEHRPTTEPAAKGFSLFGIRFGGQKA